MRQCTMKSFLFVLLISSGCSAIDFPRVKFTLCSIPPSDGDVVLIAVYQGALCNSAQKTELVVSTEHTEAHAFARNLVLGQDFVVDSKPRDKPVSRVLIDPGVPTVRVMASSCAAGSTCEKTQSAQPVIQSRDVLAIGIPGRDRQLDRQFNRMTPKEEKVKSPKRCWKVHRWWRE